MDYSSLPKHPNGFDDPSDHWQRRFATSDEKAAIALLGVLLSLPLIVAGVFVVGLALWWIWFIGEHVIAPLLALIV